MGFIGSIVGADSGNSGGAGLNYQAGATGLINPVTGDMINQANNATQNALNQQQAFVTALQGQNGIGNQSQVFGQQQQLANQLQGVANGTGPNPAQAQLAQQTAANTANQAALMAGQRGTSSNAGLLARQVAQQGAANQQNAVGQAATLQANQQIAGMNALAGQQANMANLATNQVGQQGNATQALTAAQMGEQNNLFNATAAYNTANVNQMASQNSANSAVSQQAAQQQGQFFNGAMSGLSGGALAGLAKGGVVRQNYADGSPSVQLQTNNAPQSFSPPPANAPQSAVGQSLSPSTRAPLPQEGSGGYAVGKGLNKLIGAGVKSLFGNNQAPTDKLSASDTSSMQGNGTPGGELAAGQSQDQSFNDMQQAMAGLGDQPAQGDLAPGQTSDSAFQDMSNATPDPSSNQYTPGNTSPNEDHNVSVQSDDDAIAQMGADAGDFAKGGNVKKRQHLDQGGSSGSPMSSLMSLAPLALMALNKGGQPSQPKKVPAMVSPGEAYISPDKLREAVAKHEHPLKKAEIIPGKAKVKGDSLKNDTVPKTLEEGGLVIPRSVMQSKTPMKDSIKFIHEHMKKTKLGKKA